MQSATKNLENDHVHILRLIDCMECMTRAEKPDPTSIELIVKIIREFADGQHHAKEEKLLFPLLIEKGFSSDKGPVAVMLQDHTQARKFVSEIVRNLSLLKFGNRGSVAAIYDNMLGYAGLLRHHIAKENNVLFRMADHELTETEQEKLFQEFQTIENGSNGELSKNEFASMIDSLETKYHIKQENNHQIS